METLTCRMTLESKAKLDGKGKGKCLEVGYVGEARAHHLGKPDLELPAAEQLDV